MYLDCTVEIPSVPGKISCFRKGSSVYVRYQTGRVYHPDKKYNVPDFKTIGKREDIDPSRMKPNENFLKYFGDVELPELRKDESRSSCLRIGAFLVIRRIIRDYGLPDILLKYLGARDTGLLLDLAAYSIVCENNAGQYYPDYAYHHPLFAEKMHIYSDSKVSEFLASITDDQRVGFLNEWNASRDHREKIYISYDSTNKNNEAGDLRLVEFGHPKDDRGFPIFNYSMAYDSNNREPLFYEQYPGSIVDVSQLQFMLEKAKGYGYRHVGFILDRGYFSKGNIRYMDECGYDFIIMVKGMSSLVNEMIYDRKGTFESKRSCFIRRYHTYGVTIKHPLYAVDDRDRYFHLYYSNQKEAAERAQLEAKIERMTKYLESLKGDKVAISGGYEKYFELEYHPDGTFLYPREKEETIEREISICGYFAIVTSQKMTAADALELYKSRDVSEKLFRGDKTFLGNRSLRIQSDDAASGKIFVEFIATIIRSRMYVLLQDEIQKLEHRPNYMNVTAALKELEKIEMIRGYDGRYRMDHAVTATQKTILKAFAMDHHYVISKAEELSDLIEKCTENKSVVEVK